MSGDRVADIYIRESTEALLQGYSPHEMVKRCRDKAIAIGAKHVDKSKARFSGWHLSW